MKIDFAESFAAFHKDFKTVFKYLLGPISDEILGCKGHTNAVHKKALLYHKFFCFDRRCKTLLKRSREAVYELLFCEKSFALVSYHSAENNL